MINIRPLAFAATALGLCAAAAGTAEAQSITQRGGVTVFRAIEDAPASETRQITRERGGVTVFRGRGATITRAPLAPTPPPRHVITAGEDLWVVDRTNGVVVGCDLQYDFYGNRVVVCSSPNN